MLVALSIRRERPGGGQRQDQSECEASVSVVHGFSLFDLGMLISFRVRGSP